MKKVKLSKGLESDVTEGHGVVSILNRVFREGFSKTLTFEQNSR